VLVSESGCLEEKCWLDDEKKLIVVVEDALLIAY
jgi:hypothetical protein